MDGINLNALSENASRLGMRIQETIAEHTRDLTLIRGGGSLFDMADDKAKNITKQLESSSDREKLDAMKRLIALISKNRPVSSYFPAVVKNVASTNLELRKLVYIYLLRCTPSEPDLALLSINTFQRDLADPSPLIRAMALRVLSGIRVPTVATIVLMAVRKSAADPSPYVRKAAALAVMKVYRLDRAHYATLVDILMTLLRDRSPLSLGTAVLALDNVAPSRLDLLHAHFRRLCRALPDIDAWGQVDVLRVLVRYARTMLPKPVLANESQGDEEDKDLKLLLVCAEPLFMSKNPAVVLAVARAFYYLAPPSMLSKIAAPLLHLLSVSREIERVTLAYLLIVSRSHPTLFVNYHTRFLVRTDDAEPVKRTKISILLTLCTVDNHQALLREFVDYAQDIDDSVVGDAIDAIGRIARLVPSATPQCLTALMGMINSKQDIIVSNAVLVLKSLVQNQLLTPSSASTTTLAPSLSSQLTSSALSLVPSNPISSTPPQMTSTTSITPAVQAPLSIIAQLARRIDDIRHPHARACVLWLVGQYGKVAGAGTTVEGVADWAPDVLRKAARSFKVEASLVKLQTLTLAAKLTLLAPVNRTLILLARYVLTLARYDEDWDVRDRGRVLGSLLVGVVAGVVSSNEEEATGEHWVNEEQERRQGGVVLRREQVMRVLFEGKTGTIEEEAMADPRPLGTLSLVMEGNSPYLHDHDDEDTVDLPEWLEQGIDPSLRDSDDDVPQPISSMSVVQAISSQGIPSQHAVASASVTPIVLTPTGGSTPKDTKDWRDLDKFYASESESEEEAEEVEDEDDGDDREESEASGEDSGEDDENEEDEEEEVANNPSHDQTQ